MLVHQPGDGGGLEPAPVADAKGVEEVAKYGLERAAEPVLERDTGRTD